MSRSLYEWEFTVLPHDFQVDDNPPRFTGILDKNGEPIYHKRERVGFVTEWPTPKPRIRVKAR